MRNYRAAFICRFLAFPLLWATTGNAAPVDFQNMEIASTAYGRIAKEGHPNLMKPYHGKIYFISYSDGTAFPSKLNEYDPADGLLREYNHRVIAQTDSSFEALAVMKDRLYISEANGVCYSYDGETFAALQTSPADEGDYVTAMAQFGDWLLFGTMKGKIYRSEGETFEVVYDAEEETGEPRRIIDLAAWNGWFFASVDPPGFCCPAQSYVIRSRDIEPGSWESVYGNVYRTNLFLSTQDFLYVAVTDSAYCYCSSVRRSADGSNFDVISTSGGRYKLAWDALYHDGIAYIFENESNEGNGYIVEDDGLDSNVIENGEWNIKQAVELNGDIYALAIREGFDEQPTDYYLLTTHKAAVRLFLPSQSTISCLGAVPIYLTTPEPVSALSVGVTHDPSVVEIRDIVPGAACEEIGYDYFEARPAGGNVYPDPCPDGRVGGTMTVVFSMGPEVVVLPPGEGYEVARFFYRAVRVGSCRLEFADCLGLPAVRNTCVTPDGSVTPETRGGGLEVKSACFVRGDVSPSWGNVDIGDAVGILQYLFQGRSESCSACPDSCDANDDGDIDVSDVIRILEWLFARGAPLPPPVLMYGADPTEDSLGCESYPPNEDR